MNGLVSVLNGAAVPWADAMWAAVWQSSILAGAIFLVGVVFKKTPPAIRYWLWMFIGLRLLVMPFVTMEFAVIPAPDREAPPAAVHAPDVPRLAVPAGGAAENAEVFFGRVNRGDYGSAAAAEPVVPLAGAPGPALSLKAALLLLWCAGLTIAMAHLARTCLRTHRVIAGSRFDDRRLGTLAAHAGTYFGMAAPPRVGISSRPVPPFVYGVWKPVIILPGSLVNRASDDQLLAVLAHEIAHIRRRDPLLGWVFALSHALYFFHPALPLVKRQLLLERERACDDWVLAVSNARPSTYARVLVAVAALCGAPRQAVPALVTGESFQDLKKRLLSLHGESGSRARISPAAGVLLALLGLLAAPGIDFTQRSANALSAAADAVPAAAETFAGAPAVNGVYAAEAPAAEITAAETPAAEAPVAGPADRTNEAGTPTRMQTLHFPVDHAVGTLYVKDRAIAHYIDRYWYWNDDMEWSYAGSAHGAITIPENQLVWLILDEHGARDTAFLRHLDPDAIYRLSVPYSEKNQPNVGDRGMEDVISLTGLRHLELRFSHVTDRGLALLQKLTNLERLDVPEKTTDTGLAHIAGITTLQGLYLHQNQAGDAGIAHLEALTNLRELMLGGGQISDASLAHLAVLPNLEYLMLWGKAFGDGGMLHVSRIPNLTNLNASSLELTNRGVQYLAQSPKLETLDLYGVKAITGPALEYLSELKTLRRLNLSCPPGESSRLNGYSMSFLTKCSSLEALDAPRALDDSGLAYIAKLPRLRELNTWCSSADPAITDKGVFALASMHSLRTLSLFGGGITDAGLTALGGMADLESLTISTESTAISNNGVVELANLKKLAYLNFHINRKSGVTLAALSGLNTLASVAELTAIGFVQDDSVLDLAPMRKLRKVSFWIEGGLHDDDVACFSGMESLRWLQGLMGVTDAGVAHIAGLTQLERLFIGGDGVTDGGLEQLAGLTALNSLMLEGDFTDSGIQVLRSLQGLQRLDIKSATPLSDGAQERLIAALQNLEFYNRKAMAGAGGAFGG